MSRPPGILSVLLVVARLGIPPAGAAESTQSAATGPAAAESSGDKRRVLDRKLSDYLNRELPQWLSLSGEIRTRFEDRTAFSYQKGADDAYVLTRFRLNAELRPAPWLRFFVQAQDSRVGALDPARAGPAFKNTLDLRQAYLLLGNPEAGRLGLKVGRQELLFGVQRLVGPLDWTNTARSFDAVKLELSFPGKRIRIFSSAPVKIDPRRFDKPLDGETLHGVYASLNEILPRAVLEPYFLYKTAPTVAGELGETGDLDRYTIGLRVASQSDPGRPGGFDYAAEMARQAGSFASGKISAWAGYAILGYVPRSLRFEPHFSLELSYASGDRDRGDGKAGTFDDLYPTNHLYYGLADLIGWRNIENLRAGMEMKPHRRLKLVLDYHWFWLASRQDDLYHAGGGVAARVPPGGARHRDIGQEVDISALGNLSNQLQLGAGLGVLSPGRFLEESSPGSASSFSYIFVSYKF